jgi:hypothetical protein
MSCYWKLFSVSYIKFKRIIRNCNLESSKMYPYISLLAFVKPCINLRFIYMTASWGIYDALIFILFLLVIFYFPYTGWL